MDIYYYFIGSHIAVGCGLSPNVTYIGGGYIIVRGLLLSTGKCLQTVMGALIKVTSTVVNVATFLWLVSCLSGLMRRLCIAAIWCRAYGIQIQAWAVSNVQI